MKVFCFFWIFGNQEAYFLKLAKSLNDPYAMEVATKLANRMAEIR
jgi:hypothetical protein